VTKNHQLALNILKSNRDALDRVAEGLMVWETLDLPQINALIAGEDIGVPITEKKKAENAKAAQEAEAKSAKVVSGDDPLPA